MDTDEANRIVKKFGAKELSKNPSGVRVLLKAREKYRIDLLQPKDPEFGKYWGKKVSADKLFREKNERKAKDMWGEANERKEWEKNR